MTEEEQKKLDQEHAGFFKTAVIAIAANFFAINTDTHPEQIAPAAARMAELLWDEVLKFRERQQ